MKTQTRTEKYILDCSIAFIGLSLIQLMILNTAMYSYWHIAALLLVSTIAQFVIGAIGIYLIVRWFFY